MYFVCPICGEELNRSEHGCVCPKGHAFDAARQGYVHLLPANRMHAKVPGDSKEMVDARRRFLELGHYAAFREALCGLVREFLPDGGTLLDAGCGEGYYTAALAKSVGEKRGCLAAFDISKHAVKAAAGKYKNIEFAVASSFHIPARASSADMLTEVFSPLALEEFHRVLKPGGVMILAVPSARHLFGLKETLYDRPYENGEHTEEYAGFTFLRREAVRDKITVMGKENIRALFAMTPYLWRTESAAMERLESLETLETEIGFDFLVYRKKETR